MTHVTDSAPRQFWPYLVSFALVTPCLGLCFRHSGHFAEHCPGSTNVPPNCMCHLDMGLYFGPGTIAETHHYFAF